MNEQDVEIVILVHSFFNDLKKTAAWLSTDNPHFGGASPLQLMNVNRSHKILKFVKAALDENKLDAIA